MATNVRLPSQGDANADGAKAAAFETPDAAPRVARPHIDLVWNTTMVCGWDCAICCVDAAQVTRKGRLVVVRSRALGTTEQFATDPSKGSIYDQAASTRQRAGLELSLRQKLQILAHLDGFSVKIDISGGDWPLVSENFELLRAASARFGREQITITATGAGLAHYSVADLAAQIGEFNFTYDGTVRTPGNLRPPTYSSGNLKKAEQFAALGVKTRAECPLTRHNIEPAILTQIYLDLHRAGIDTLLVMRLFPSGRGALLSASAPTTEQYHEAIALLRSLEAAHGNPRVKLQCALRHLDAASGVNPCDMVRESFGLMADGTLLASPWAIGPEGAPLDEVWVLGNLATTPLSEILASERVARFQNRLDANFGHCKLHAFVNGSHADPFERMFGTTDSLYSPQELMQGGN